MASIAGHSGMHKLVDYCSSKFAAVGIDDAIKVELKVQGHADYIKTTVVCLEWVVKSLKILFTFANIPHKSWYYVGTLSKAMIDSWKNGYLRKKKH